MHDSRSASERRGPGSTRLWRALLSEALRSICKASALARHYLDSHLPTYLISKETWIVNACLPSSEQFSSFAAHTAILHSAWLCL